MTFSVHCVGLTGHSGAKFSVVPSDQDSSSKVAQKAVVSTKNDSRPFVLMRSGELTRELPYSVSTSLGKLLPPWHLWIKADSIWWETYELVGFCYDVYHQIRSLDILCTGLLFRDICLQHPCTLFSQWIMRKCSTI